MAALAVTSVARWGSWATRAFQALTKVMCAADSTYANMEGPIIDASDLSYQGPLANGPKTIIDDLEAMGGSRCGVICCGSGRSS
jgi:hypothetical protein